MKLSHEETLNWIQDHRAWRLAKKTKPIWARPIDSEEIGKPFRTADHVDEVAQEGYWLCAGIAGEPWFQKLEKIEKSYDQGSEEQRRFDFDTQPRQYTQFQPKESVRKWAAQVRGTGIEGFSIRPNYDLERPLYSPAGGYVVKDDVPDPYSADSNDVWLVQEKLFESTYEFIP